MGSSERPGGSVATRAEPEMVVGSAAMRAAPARRVQRDLAMGSSRRPGGSVATRAESEIVVGSSEMLGGSVATVTRRSPKTATRREQRPGTSGDAGHSARTRQPEQGASWGGSTASARRRDRGSRTRCRRGPHTARSSRRSPRPRRDRASTTAGRTSTFGSLRAAARCPRRSRARGADLTRSTPLDQAPQPAWRDRTGGRRG